MPDSKPSVTHEQILALLQTHYATPITNLCPLTGGLIAQTLAFTTDGQDYVIRFAQHMGANLDKEAYLYKRIASPQIPIPRIFHVGRFGNLHYAISQYVRGQTVHTLPLAQYKQVLPALIETLHAIHQVDISDTTRYGVISDTGIALYPGWRRFLEMVREEEPEWDFYGKWHNLFKETFLERDVFDDLYAKMTSFFDACPEERFLVHGDYGFTNVLVFEGHITAVLDWYDSKYGDFMFDIARVDLFLREIPFAEHFQHFYQKRGIHVERYMERLRCYQCFISLDGLRFYAKTNNYASYQWTKQRIARLLQTS